MKSLYVELNGSYVEVGEVKIPELVSTETNYEIGFWGQKHKEYLKQNHRVIYYNLLTSGKLNSYLHKIDVQAKEQYVVIQRCMMHLIRNSIKYIPTKEYKKFTQSLKKVYAAPSLNACRKAFEQFCQEWSQYPRAIDVWKRNFNHVEQLFDYGSAIRRVMYTTNAVESINSSFRKVTKKGAFPSENALLKLLYLRTMEL